MEHSPRGQAATGLVGGFDVVVGLMIVVTLTGALETVTSSEVAHAVGSLAFGITFVLITIGRSELFTENFLVPVGARFAGRGSSAALARMWSLTFASNMVGIAALAAVISVQGVLPESAHSAAGDLAQTFATRPYGEALASAVVGGAAITVYTWSTMAVKSDGARIVLALIIGYVLLLPMLNHVIVGFGELMIGTFTGTIDASVGESVAHVGVALIGNAIGGISFVTLTRLVQVSGEPGVDG